MGSPSSADERFSVRELVDTLLKVQEFTIKGDLEIYGGPTPGFGQTEYQQSLQAAALQSSRRVRNLPREVSPRDLVRAATMLRSMRIQLSAGTRLRGELEGIQKGAEKRWHNLAKSVLFESANLSPWTTTHGLFFAVIRQNATFHYPPAHKAAALELTSAAELSKSLADT